MISYDPLKVLIELQLSLQKTDPQELGEGGGEEEGQHDGEQKVGADLLCPPLRPCQHVLCLQTEPPHRQLNQSCHQKRGEG